MSNSVFLILEIKNVKERESKERANDQDAKHVKLTMYI
jgi:hypothetical protein